MKKLSTKETNTLIRTINNTLTYLECRTFNGQNYHQKTIDDLIEIKQKITKQGLWFGEDANVTII